jgi:hypothetical protein
VSDAFDDLLRALDLSRSLSRKPPRTSAGRESAADRLKRVRRLRASPDFDGLRFVHYFSTGERASKPLDQWRREIDLDRDLKNPLVPKAPFGATRG